MEFPVFPTTIKTKPSIDFSVEKTEGVIATEFSSGYIRQRNRFNDGRRLARISWVFEGLEFDKFQSFFKYTLAFGARRFTIPLYMDTEDFQDYEVEFYPAKYSATYQEVGYWQVSATVLISNDKFISGELLDLLEKYGDDPEELLAQLDRFHYYVSTTLPNVFN